MQAPEQAPVSKPIAEPVIPVQSLAAQPSSLTTTQTENNLIDLTNSLEEPM